jgi:hypothetical protein
MTRVWAPRWRRRRAHPRRAQFTSGTSPNRLYGDDGSDYLVGSDGDDGGHGGIGDDVVEASGGNDLIVSADGDDALTGHGGADSIHGDYAQDPGGTGNDALWGEDGDDGLYGGGATTANSAAWETICSMARVAATRTTGAQAPIRALIQTRPRGGGMRKLTQVTTATCILRREQRLSPTKEQERQPSVKEMLRFEDFYFEDLDSRLRLL